ERSDTRGMGDVNEPAAIRQGHLVPAARRSPRCGHLSGIHAMVSITPFPRDRLPHGVGAERAVVGEQVTQLKIWSNTHRQLCSHFGKRSSAIARGIDRSMAPYVPAVPIATIILAWIRTHRWIQRTASRP